MKIPYCFSAILFFLPMTASAQVSEKIPLKDVCSFYSVDDHENHPDEVWSFQSNGEALEVIEDIMSTSGLSQNFVVSSANVPNATATVIGNKRHILYNVNFIANTRDSTGTKWAPISVMAHEVGHHLNNHIFDGSQRHKAELEADYFAGSIVQRLGASLDEAQAVFKTFPPGGSLTHPGRSERLAAVAAGWESACALDSGCNALGGTSESKVPETIIEEVDEQEANRQRYIKTNQYVDKFVTTDFYFYGKNHDGDNEHDLEISNNGSTDLKVHVLYSVGRVSCDGPSNYGEDEKIAIAQVNGGETQTLTFTTDGKKNGICSTIAILDYDWDAL